ncbi:MAG TPA: hypothetical protein VK281_14000, partial [Xanthobacteraceae bacterium]|nr:hypothetical protein [Xanthobacteraceae bacterium]
SRRRINQDKPSIGPPIVAPIWSSADIIEAELGTPHRNNYADISGLSACETDQSPARVATSTSAEDA